MQQESTRSVAGVHQELGRSAPEVQQESTRTYQESTRSPTGPVGECKLQIYEDNTNANNQVFPVNMRPAVHPFEASMGVSHVEAKVKEITIAVFLWNVVKLAAFFKSFSQLWKDLLKEPIHGFAEKHKVN